jgi:hypothetical protein
VFVAKCELNTCADKTSFFFPDFENRKIKSYFASNLNVVKQGLLGFSIFLFIKQKSFS